MNQCIGALLSIIANNNAQEMVKKGGIKSQVVLAVQ